jgi:hypothetical protein
MKLPLFLSIALVFSTVGVLSQDKPEDLEYSVADLNGRATLLIRPTLPGDVMISRDGTTATLKVYVDENGSVLSAKCSLRCPVDVAPAAEAAASASKFRPLIIDGMAVKYSGFLLYTIAVQRVDWYRFGGALYSTYIFDNLSLGPVAAILTTKFADEKGKLQDLDNGVDLATRWKTIEAVRDSIKTKLSGKDTWWFTLGMTLREATAPFQSDRKLNRAEIQQALSNLGKFVESAPAEIPRKSVENLKILSEYKIDAAMSAQDLNRAIYEMASAIRPEPGRPPVQRQP